MATVPMTAPTSLPTPGRSRGCLDEPLQGRDADGSAPSGRDTTPRWWPNCDQQSPALVRVLLIVLLASSSSHAAALQLEAGPGLISSNDATATSPVLRARAGMDLGWFTASAVGLAALFADPQALSHTVQDGGVRAWATAAEARFHTTGPHQLALALSVGWGKLVSLQASNGDAVGYRGHAAPYVGGSLGYRYLRRNLRLGADLSLEAFNRVDVVGDTGGAFCDSTGTRSPPVCPLARTWYFAGLNLFIGWGSD